MKIVLNRCYGGFGLSKEAAAKLGPDADYDYYDYMKRNDSKLVSIVEELGKYASGYCSDLQVISIPDEITDWKIFEYDGYESVLYVLDGKIRRT